MKRSSNLKNESSNLNNGMKSPVQTLLAPGQYTTNKSPPLLESPNTSFSFLKEKKDVLASGPKPRLVPRRSLYPAFHQGANSKQKQKPAASSTIGQITNLNENSVNSSKAPGMEKRNTTPVAPNTTNASSVGSNKKTNTTPVAPNTTNASPVGSKKPPNKKTTKSINTQTGNGQINNVNLKEKGNKCFNLSMKNILHNIDDSKSILNLVRSQNELISIQKNLLRQLEILYMLSNAI